MSASAGTFSAGELTGLPSRVTRPSAIQRSASRREETRARAVRAGSSALQRSSLLAPVAAAAQVALRWLVQQGYPVIPRSGSPQHQAANLDIFDFVLSAEEMATPRVL